MKKVDLMLTMYLQTVVVVILIEVYHAGVYTRLWLVWKTCFGSELRELKLDRLYNLQFAINSMQSLDLHILKYESNSNQAELMST